MACIELKGIDKVYKGGVLAVDNFSLEIGEHEFIILVGPSGCGKSTVLRMIAGLEEITEGELIIDGKVANQVEPKDRNVAMVFQNYALYPYMTIYDNIAFPLKMHRVKKEEIHKKVMEIAGVLQIEPYLDRKPGQLSGGQRQRAALGRAMVRNPRVFLLDEPLSNLDAKLRVAMRREIVSLYNKLDTTFIYVTHDQTEAMTMGTKIVVMNRGVIQQADTPYALYHHPKNLFVAEFIGSPQMNGLEVSAVRTEDGICAEWSGGKIVLTGKKWPDFSLRKREAVLGIRPEHIIISKERPKVFDLETVVEQREDTGAECCWHCRAEGMERLFTVKGKPEMQFDMGERVYLSFRRDKIHLFDRASGESILSE